VHACVHACVRACVHAGVRVRVRVRRWYVVAAVPLLYIARPFTIAKPFRKVSTRRRQHP